MYVLYCDQVSRYYVYRKKVVSLHPYGSDTLITALTTICNKIWQMGEWPTPLTKSFVITLPKVTYCCVKTTEQLVSSASQVLLKIILP